MNISFTSLICCGVKELNGLQWFNTPKEAFLAYANRTYLKTAAAYKGDGSIEQIAAPFERFRFVVFTQATRRASYGKAFEKFIKQNSLGTVIATDFHNNPNSGNYVKVWVWTVDHAACRRLLESYALKLPPPQTTAAVVPEIN